MAKVRVKYQTVELGTSDFHLRTLRDRQQWADPGGIAESYGISSAAWPLFGILWRSEELLSSMMVDEDVGERRVLEVGCGIALASLVLQSRGANVTATDYHPEAATFLNLNSELNGLTTVPFERESWHDAESRLPRFDLVIGSDLLYDHHNVGPLVTFVDAHVAQDGAVLVVDPRRGLTGAFIRQLESCGFSAQVENVDYESTDGASAKYLVMRFVRSKPAPVHAD